MRSTRMPADRGPVTPHPPTRDADILNFIHKKAAKKRQARPLQWWEKLASPTKQQWAYANAYHRAEEYAKKRGALRSPPKKTAKQRRRAGRHPPMRKKKPPKQKTCMTLMELARAFTNIAQQVCFIPNNRPSIRWWDESLAANRRWTSGYKRTLHPLGRASCSS